MSTIKNKMLFIGVLMASAIGISAHAAIQVNALTPNALTPNALTPNALTPNALTPNALTPNALNPNAFNPNALSVNALNTNAISVASSPQSAVDPAPLRTALRVLGSKPLVTSHP